MTLRSISFRINSITSSINFKSQKSTHTHTHTYSSSMKWNSFVYKSFDRKISFFPSILCKSIIRSFEMSKLSSTWFNISASLPLTPFLQSNVRDINISVFRISYERAHKIVLFKKKYSPSINNLQCNASFWLAVQYFWINWIKSIMLIEAKVKQMVEMSFFLSNK